MNRDDAFIALWGRRFYPSRLRLRGAVQVVNANDPGAIGTIGRYRRQKLPFGSCRIRCAKAGRNIAFLAEHLRRHSGRYKKAGATSIVFWILWRGSQGNTELTARELSRLAATRVPLAMDYIFEEEPNKALEPTSGTVTPRAGARVAPVPPVAHL